MRISFRSLASCSLAFSLLSPSLAIAAQKQPICGLVEMGKMSFLETGGVPTNALEEARAHPGIYKSAVVLATWAQLEPQRGMFNMAAIESGLAAIRTYNAANPGHPMTAKLRIVPGQAAPDWVKTMGGPPITLDTMRATMTIGRFWSQPYIAAWQELQAALAARYDNDPMIQEVAVSSCASMTAEPFVIPAGPRNRPGLESAGLTEQAYQACLMNVPQDYAAWHNTPLDYTFNAFSSASKGEGDVAFTLQVMQHWRQVMQGRGVIANHGLIGMFKNDKQKELYADLATMGPPIEFQFLGPTEDIQQAMQKGFAYHASEIEMWTSHDAGGPALFSMGDLQQWSTQFQCGQ